MNPLCLQKRYSNMEYRPMTWQDKFDMYVEILTWVKKQTNWQRLAGRHRKWWSTYTNIWLVTTNSIGQGPHQWWWVWWKEKIWEDCSQYCTQHSHYTQFLHSPLIEFRHLKVSPSLPPLGSQYTVRDKIIHLENNSFVWNFSYKMVKDVVFPMVAHQMAWPLLHKQYLCPPQECKPSCLGPESQS